MKKTKRIVTGTICSVSVIISMVLANHSSEIRTSEAGLEIIGNAESCVREPYYCPANALTVGIGSTVNVEQKTYSDEEIAKRWVDDIKTAEQCINRHANGFHLPQSVFDAVTSITFNVGCTKMRASTMYRYLNTGEYKAACNEFPKWNKAGGKVLNGLVARREKERALCLSYALSSPQ
ncbi:lysozyme [Gilliamella sp. B2776]|uniref:lysozyme n=1 Tax=unclassified Gilliamella TaxID=2685620 RepID=UPI002269CABE|nr:MULTISPECIES: lysozyme [unclassified Gilliamella]MCX8650964.1 lysozyme [Gilliamella sp. B2779]MCX8653546.1 lysozyme [Gilliamella sp. B2737]MCX8656525.1 lysozyme [Gilliamella sp. B2894]MCX8665968.1 lysozyme [Gilliamella sp. B2887]MCX8692772.1 lysozyme [Gilliamella sp. B2776]